MTFTMNWFYRLLLHNDVSFFVLGESWNLKRELDDDAEMLKRWPARLNSRKRVQYWWFTSENYTLNNKHRANLTALILSQIKIIFSRIFKKI